MDAPVSVNSSADGCTIHLQRAAAVAVKCSGRVVDGAGVGQDQLVSARRLDGAGVGEPIR